MSETTPIVHWAHTNLRELGGYPTADGGAVRRGVFFRGGRMNELSAEATAVYEGLGLRRVIDLRRPDEIAGAPTPAFPGAENLPVSVSSGDGGFAEMANRIDDPEAATKMAEGAVQYYRRIITDRLPLYVPVFDAIVDNPAEPVLFHCTAGKDRTGFVAACLLGWLDVDDDTIMADYLATNTVRAGYAEERLAQARRQFAAERGVEPEEIPDTAMDGLRFLLGVDESMLAASIEAMRSTFGDWHGLRRDGLGISDERLATWRTAVVDHA